MIKHFYWAAAAACLLTNMLHADPDPSECNIDLKRIQSLRILGDDHLALNEIRYHISQHPDCPLLTKVHISTLAELGMEQEMFAAWKRFYVQDPESACDRELLEEMAWGVIRTGQKSSLPIVRAMTVIAAAISQDAKGIRLLCSDLYDPNPFVRSMAAEFSAKMKDQPLKEAVLKRLSVETNWLVRIGLIQAIGSMPIKEGKNRLLALLQKETTPHDEKLAIVAALVNINEEATPEQVKTLIQSKRSGDKLLACGLVMEYQSPELVKVLLPLLTDTRTEVREYAIETLITAMPHAKTIPAIDSYFIPLLKDPLDKNQICAAKALTLLGNDHGKELFRQTLNSKDRITRLMAAGALASCGKYGQPLIDEYCHTHTDPFVRMNLALSLIAQQKEIQSSCNLLYTGLTSQSERWMWKQLGSFRVLMPSDLKPHEVIPNYPEAINQLTRLELLNILAMAEYPQACQAVQSFLACRRWGVSELAAGLLLTEGDDNAIKIVQNLVTDPDPHIALQAAFLLGFWGGSPEAIKILRDAYPTADWETKGRILEALSRIGDVNELSFLAAQLNEPHQTLRVIAAASLISLLYN